MKAIVKVLLMSLIVFVLSQCKKDTNPYVTIPDDNLLNALIERGVDKNGDGIISTDEAAQVHTLDVSHNNISDLKGIEAFVNLDTLECGWNLLTTLDVSNNRALKMLLCSSNNLTALYVSNNHELIVLDVPNNELTSLNVSNNPVLEVLECGKNSLTSLDVSNCPALNILKCELNSLTSLDVSNNDERLTWILCGGNMLTSLNISNNPALTILACTRNSLTILDVSNNPKLGALYCDENLLTTINLSNSALYYINLASMPSLSEVCVWTMPFPPTGVTVDTTGSPNVYLTMTCN